MSDPASDLSDAAIRTAKYIREMGREIGDAEARHGPNSEEARRKRKQFHHEVTRITSVASDIHGIADAIDDVKREYNL